MKGNFILCFFLISLSNQIYAQNISNFVIKGKVIDNTTAEGIPFAAVYFKDKNTIGTTTDFEGNYEIKTPILGDSLSVQYVGYKTLTKAVNKTLKLQVIDFQLEPDVQKLPEAVVYAGENPAHPIMRKVIKNKSKNDWRNLDALEYESYSKTELDLDNLSAKMSKRKLVGKIISAVDSIGKLTGEDGKPIIPLAMSEIISIYYYNQRPEKVKEHIIKSKLVGVGLKEDGIVSQLVGSSFQNYNFYRNWISMFFKDFISPLTDGWWLHYEYYLVDSLYIGDRFCYKIEVYPQRKQDLAFTGTIWIDKETYGLKQIDVQINKDVNINFVEKIKIQQEFLLVPEGSWVPYKTRIVLDISEITKNSAGMIAKFYVSNKNFVVNKARFLKFYDERVTKEEDYTISDESYWQKARHDTLTEMDKKVFAMIDTIKQIPLVQTYVNIVDFLSTGYQRIGKIDFGNVFYSYAFNNVEGHRFRVGLKTNAKFSKKWILRGFLAYGTQDEQFKYDVNIRYLISRKPWTLVGIRNKQEVEMISAVASNEDTETGLFTASMRFADMESRQPYWKNERSIFAQRDLFKGFTQKIILRNYNFNAFEAARFAYKENPHRPDSRLRSTFINSELTIESRWAFGEAYVINGNDRVLITSDNKPVITFRYQLGIRNFLQSEFEYHKFSLNISHYFSLGAFGNGFYSLTGVYNPNPLPYPLLEVHLGNESIFFNRFAFNLMNFSEFTSNNFWSLFYEHNFEGLIMNRIPLIRRLKWRNFASLNIVQGTLSRENRNLIPLTDEFGREVLQPRTFADRIPYIEISYGIDNIFKFFKVHFTHRLNYLDRPNTRRFGVLFSATFKL
ncbi:MAG: DUF5686 and carboxypeptidase regulatory-like domain-containing protein [Microscillaceae bacterium]|nr:DUF5686 and carboxypeptidase regulatory-like domain-containing protein [Microscillaceae bacterium]MDW8460411.1 DUF5686 family protein [Cytophagales bacterium]